MRRLIELAVAGLLVVGGRAAVKVLASAAPACLVNYAASQSVVGRLHRGRAGHRRRRGGELVDAVLDGGRQPTGHVLLERDGHPRGEGRPPPACPCRMSRPLLCVTMRAAAGPPVRRAERGAAVPPGLRRRHPAGAEPAGMALSAPPPTGTWNRMELKIDGTAATIDTWLNGTAVPALVADGIPAHDVDGQWLTRTCRPGRRDLKPGRESYGDESGTLWHDDIVAGSARNQPLIFRIRLAGPLSANHDGFMGEPLLHPDRLLPVQPEVRAIARRLYDEVRHLPIISPHGHVDPRMLLDDPPFPDPAALFIQPDHYVTRLLHAGGVTLDRLGVGAGPLPPDRARAAWRLLCENWHLLRGTPVRYWLDAELGDIFGITSRPDASNADSLYDRIAEQLAAPSHRPRALLDRFGIEFLATTDDPADDLSTHAALAADPSIGTRVAPTFRPDKYLEAGRTDWPDLVKALGEAADVDVSTYGGYVEALRQRRRHFVDHGAVSADHSHPDAYAEPLGGREPESIFRRALAGQASSAETVAFRRHMLFQMAGMSVEDGLVMTLHPGIYRNHHPETLHRYGPDTGHDIPVTVEFTRALQPLLAAFGTEPGFHLVLFTVDADVFSREIAPLAGFYPSVYAGAPWWFLDNPSAIRDFQRSVTEIAGFGRLSGFIDDTRAFCSIPARHDMSRRLDAGHLAQLVAEHRLGEDEAADTLRTLVAEQPKRVFKL